jgi:hypothetical protein
MKRTSVVICGLLCLSFLIAASGLLAEPACKVERIAFATSVENREPVGESSEFDQSVGRVWCWTKISASNPPVEVKHVWYKDGEKVLEVPLEVNYPSTRTWSNKAISPGAWKVEVVDADGQVITSAEFKVK